MERGGVCAGKSAGKNELLKPGILILRQSVPAAGSCVHTCLFLGEGNLLCSALRLCLCRFPCVCGALPDSILCHDRAVLAAAHIVQQSPVHSPPSVTCLLGLPYTVCPQAVAAIWSANKRHSKVCPHFCTVKVRAGTRLKPGCNFTALQPETKVGKSY